MSYEPRQEMAFWKRKPIVHLSGEDYSHTQVVMLCRKSAKAFGWDSERVMHMSHKMMRASYRDLLDLVDHFFEIE